MWFIFAAQTKAKRTLFAAKITNNNKTTNKMTEKQWFDMRSASQYTSLSRKTLLGAIRDRILPARLTSEKTGGKYITSRADLDNYMNSLAKA